MYVFEMGFICTVYIYTHLPFPTDSLHIFFRFFCSSNISPKFSMDRAAATAPDLPTEEYRLSALCELVV